MKLISGLWTLCVMTITLVSANECALNTECVPIADCPYIRDRFDLIENKPYCNFDRHGTHVCCVKSANECARDTECVPIADCPYVRDRFDLIENKPYCSLDLHGTHVCCVKPKQIYTQPEDVDLRIVTASSVLLRLQILRQSTKIMLRTLHSWWHKSDS
uniref:WAP domain-containing protein n=1 Tax=Glossina pallidipes TaxID=7398 RepID=A0A1A9ZTA4_GLOPL